MFFNSLKTFFLPEIHMMRSLFKLLGPLGIACRIAGQFPLNASLTDGGTLLVRYSFFSVASFYNLFTLTFPCCVYLYKRVDRKSIKTFYTIYSASFRCTQILTQLLTIQGWPNVSGLVAALENYDSQLHQLPVLVNCKPVATSNKLVWITIPFLQLLNTIFLEVTYGSKDHFYHSIRPISAAPLMLQTVLFFFFLKELINRTKHLQKSWILYIKIAARHNYSAGIIRLDLYRSLHTKLVHCFSLLNSAFALTLFVAISLLFLDLITEPYHAYKSGHFGHRFSDRLWCFVLIAFIANFTAKLESVVNIVLDDIFDTRLTGLSKSMRSHLDLLVYQLDRSKVQIEVPGLVVFSREFMGSFVVVSVTYFILSAQITTQFLL